MEIIALTYAVVSVGISLAWAAAVSTARPRWRDWTMLLWMVVLWPVVLPLAAWSRSVRWMGDIHAKPQYKALLQERDRVEVESTRIGNRISDLCERLGNVGELDVRRQLTADLVAAVERLEPVDRRHAVYEQLRHLYWKHESSFDRDPDLRGRPPDPLSSPSIPVRYGPTEESLQTKDYTRFRYRGKDWEVTVSVESLERSLLGATSLASGEFDKSSDSSRPPFVTFVEPVQGEDWIMLVAPTFTDGLTALTDADRKEVLGAVVAVLEDRTGAFNIARPRSPGNAPGLMFFRVGGHELLYVAIPAIRKVIIVAVKPARAPLQ